MDGKNLIHRLQLDDDAFRDDEIDPVSAVQERTFVLERDWYLPSERDPCNSSSRQRQCSYVDSSSPGPSAR
ncbi:MAG: hypothetical protein JWM53_5010 [bacterium]|nr:hypothetical protein [bacterium]